LVNDAPTPSWDPINDVFFTLFTRSNPLDGQVIGFDLSSIASSNWNPSHNVRILVHGWLNNVNAPENPRATADFLRRGDYNVIGKIKH
jgi:Lipase